jgi:carboxyl-terminal processing protease
LKDDYTFVLSDNDKACRKEQHKSRCVTEAQIIGNNVGYIKLDSFSGCDAVGEMKKALRTVAHADGVILDLRGNHGGYIEAAREVFGLLADEGPFVSYRGFASGGSDEETYILKRDRWYIEENGKMVALRRQRNVLGHKPLAVLVNEDTRSAAEMLSGALRDNGLAMVLGKQTYGKGVLQDTFELGEHLTMKVVTAKYFLPSGVNIHEKGIEPDVRVDGSEDEQLSRATQLFSSTIAHSNNARRENVAVVERSADRL